MGSALADRLVGAGQRVMWDIDASGLITLLA
jgi:hypothetical protein